MAAGLAGCSANLLGGSNDQTAAISAPAAAPAAQPAPQTKLALAPVVGAPEAVNANVAGQLRTALERQHVTVVGAADKSDYTLRGYMVAAKEKSGVKVSYIWDITDPAGKRANRIQGEELVKAAPGADAWGAVTAEVTQAISDKTASSIATSLASLAPAVSAASAPVGVGAPPASNQSQASQPVQTASLQTGNQAAAVNRPTATSVAAVTGAPGDGNTSLMAAMRQELQTAGLPVAQAGAASYTVAGKVTVGPTKDGKQAIRIDWKVTEPGGKVLATVTQNNDIPAGQLDGPWGQTAEDAAQGAAVKIKTLIDESQTAAARAPVRREVTKSKT